MSCSLEILLNMIAHLEKDEIKLAEGESATLLTLVNLDCRNYIKALGGRSALPLK